MADAAGNDLQAVGVPITGMIAVCHDVAQANVVADAKMSANPVELPGSKWVKLGLITQDGGLEFGNESGDALEFFQDGYKLSGAGSRTMSVTLAEDNPAVRRLLDGAEPDSNGVVYVEDSHPDGTFLVFSLTRFKNGAEERRHGVARVSEIEVDQEERGSVRGKKVTIEWLAHDLFKGKPYKKWFGVPGTARGDH